MLMKYLQKIKKEYKHSKQQEAPGDIYQSKLDKVCFHHNMIYVAYKYLPRRTTSEKVLCKKLVAIDSNPKYGGYQRGLISMFYKFFDKNSKNTGIHTGARIFFGYQQLHKRIARKIKNHNICSSYQDNILGTDTN